MDVPHPQTGGPLPPRPTASRRVIVGVIALICGVLVGVTLAFYRHQPNPPAKAPAAPPRQSSVWHVAPDGRADNPGTEAEPLSLAGAVIDGGPVGAGDTVWVHGGTYRGTFKTTIKGTADAPVVIRAVPGERVTIDSAPAQEDAFYVVGEHVWFWGLEIMNSDPRRTSTESYSADIRRGIGASAHAAGTKFINVVVHDMTTGLGIWSDATDAEVYGSLVYHNGFDAADRGHGHGIYAQSDTGIRQFTDNILFGGFSHGIHAYGSSAAALNDIQLEGNIVFNSGVLAALWDRNLLIGGGVVAKNPVLRKNYTYYSPGVKRGGDNNVGLSAGCTNLIAEDNYWAHFGSYPLVLANCIGAIRRNVLLGAVSAEQQAQYPENQYLSAAPSTTVTFVRPNKYEPGRAHVVIYNWARLPAVSLDLAGAGLTQGQAFEIRDAQNFYGPPVVDAVFTGAPVRIPMADLTAVRPVGDISRPPAHTAPEFGAFVVLPKGTASGAAPRTR